MDEATAKKQRLNFARVCAVIPVVFDYPSSIKIKIHGRHVVIGVEYPWKPQACSHCNRFGHVLSKCPTRPAQVWVPRSQQILERDETSTQVVPVEGTLNGGIETRNQIVIHRSQGCTTSERGESSLAGNFPVLVSRQGAGLLRPSLPFQNGFLTPLRSSPSNLRPIRSEPQENLVLTMENAFSALENCTDLVEVEEQSNGIEEIIDNTVPKKELQ
ncbi:hypothetical protein IFM89_020140 [Coptis chinensis]|uniref:CCHC-type domain-containing protein n=1 Tax=Coptis chinensis TaxID=261450 RepID=A0A835H5N3_9MAGN|nr:hypothetical protein IFM89_020140 [Coptis chinensis]